MSNFVSEPHLTRRRMIRSMVCGSSILFPGILGQVLGAKDRSGEDVNPLAPKKPHLPARAKRVILLYMSGGVSHVDTFDPKPRLTADHGKLVAAVQVRQMPNGRDGASVYVRPFFDFQPRGK